MIVSSKIKRQMFMLMFLFMFIINVHSASAAGVRIAVVDTSYSQLAAFQVRALHRAGASVSVITSSNINVSKYDGLVIPGGSDVTPSLYGEKYHGAYGCSMNRDKLQLRVIKKFVKAGKPILGICRGAQILNVAFGGTLHQDKHGHWNGVWRNIKIEKDSFLYGIYGSKESTVHYHHQACKKMGDGLVVTARSTDNKHLVESFEHESLPIYGMQWHPEFMGARGAKVYSKFVKTCKQYKK